MHEQEVIYLYSMARLPDGACFQVPDTQVVHAVWERCKMPAAIRHQVAQYYQLLWHNTSATKENNTSNQSNTNNQSNTSANNQSKENTSNGHLTDQSSSTQANDGTRKEGAVGTPNRALELSWMETAASGHPMTPTRRMRQMTPNLARTSTQMEMEYS